MQGPVVWIVHEQLHIVLLLRNAIAMHGCRSVTCFTNGDGVLARVRQGERPDIIVVAESLTGTSGNDLLSLVDTMCGTCAGILLVSHDADSYSSRYRSVTVGDAGFHESLIEALDQVARGPVLACAAA